jgi:hypothetical protein
MRKYARFGLGLWGRDRVSDNWGVYPIRGGIIQGSLRIIERSTGSWKKTPGFSNK